ncbi:16842_t:CDS:1 [Dentiscutata erythropus]|uniref:16842_t:CDS:1 n=1 Tax=Dentiscutata erythropus TaxID=1348616 RepID=A0A9N9CE67_9GLOM|nr:16842_t:CDS:1 [Dentiscutata erythropus]
MEILNKPEVDNVKFSKQSTFSAYNNSLNPMSPKKTGSIKRKHSHSQKTTISNYPSVGELLWDNGKMFSDVKLSFEDREGLAARAGIPSELRLHSLILFQSQFFKEQLSQTSSNVSSLPKSNMRKEKQIIVKLPYRVNEEDMVNFYCTLKLMYTKKWDIELANNLAKGVGCLSVCWEIGFHEGIEACWKWLVRKCSRDRNKEMMKKLIDAYPRLHERFTHQVDNVNSSLAELLADTSLQRAPSLTKNKKVPTLPRRSMRRPKNARRITKTGDESEKTFLSPLLKSDNSDTSTLSSSNSSLSPKASSNSLKSSSASPKVSSTSLRTQYENGIPTPHQPTINNSLPSPPLSASPSLSPVLTQTLLSSHTMLPFPTIPTSIPTSFNNVQILDIWISKFETFSIMSRRSCANLPLEDRDDNRCFPFLGHFGLIFESINQLGRSKIIASKDCLDFALRMLNVIKIEHSHFHMLHNAYNQKNGVGEELLSQSIVLHESLDEPLTILLKEILSPIDQKHLCDYLWAPSNISNLMHLREIRNGNSNLMEDEFEEYEEIMREVSLIEGSRVSHVEHMIVGEKMAKAMRGILAKSSYKFI